VYGSGSLVAVGFGALVVDGVGVVVGDRVLVKDQLDLVQNGVYRVSAAGDVGNVWVLVRASDFDEDGEVSNGSFVFVEDGVVNGGSGWVMTSPNPVVVGVDGVVWSQFSGGAVFSAGAGLGLVGGEFSVNVDGVSLDIVADVLVVRDGGVGNGKLDALKRSLLK
jgi:hypothetical protein